MYVMYNNIFETLLISSVVNKETQFFVSRLVKENYNINRQEN